MTKRRRSLAWLTLLVIGVAVVLTGLVLLLVGDGSTRGTGVALMLIGLLSATNGLLEVRRMRRAPG